MITPPPRPRPPYHTNDPAKWDAFRAENDAYNAMLDSVAKPRNWLTVVGGVALLAVVAVFFIVRGG